MPDFLKLIGYWQEDKTAWMHPSKYVNPNWKVEDKSQIIQYLNKGVPLFAFLGVSHCRFDCGIDDVAMGHRELTDGEWIWPEGLAHYVEYHSVKLPDQFIITIKANTFHVPNDLDTEALFEVPKSYEFWKSWCGIK